MMRFLVIGGTGKTGSACLGELRGAGAEGIPASRSPPDGGVRIDLADPASVEAGARGFDGCYLVTPIGPDEAALGVEAVRALRRAGCPKIVYMAIHNLEAMREIPHFEAKIPVKRAVLNEGAGVVIEPNFFFQNDWMFRDAILGAGVYPMPLGSTGVWSVDAGDIGRAAARALTMDDWDGRAVPICGAQRLTGPEIAETYARLLRRPVRYGGDELDGFVGALRARIPGFGEWEAHDFRTMMAVTQARGCPATADDVAGTEAILGRRARRHADFAAALVEGRA